MAMPAQVRLLLFQLLPVLAFLLVDGLVNDPAWAIAAALTLVLGQTLVIYLRERRLDPFAIFDVVLIGGLGAVSLLSKNELFFKLKPAIMEAVIVPFFLVLAFGGERLLQGYFGRFFPQGTGIRPEALPVLRSLIAAMSVLILVHAAVVLWAALDASRRTWGIIAGPGFYVILVPFVVFALYRRLRRRRAPEVDSEVDPGSMRSARGRPSARHRDKA